MVNVLLGKKQTTKNHSSCCFGFDKPIYPLVVLTWLIIDNPAVIVDLPIIHGHVP